MKKILKSKRGEGYIDVCVLVLCAMLVIALAVQVLPVFIAKNQLDTYATERVCLFNAGSSKGAAVRKERDRTSRCFRICKGGDG